MEIMNKKEYKKPEISELNSNLTKGMSAGPGGSIKTGVGTEAVSPGVMDSRS